MASHRVNFIDKDDAGGIFLALLEKITNAAGADAYKHFNEVRTGNGEKWNVGFAGHCARQQGLTRSRRPNQQHAFGNASAQLLELLRLAQEFDNLFQFFLGFIHTGHVLERDLLLLHREQPGPALTE